MKIIGITGGIGSGKSTVAKALEIKGIPVYRADVESKRLTRTSEEIRRLLTERFGTLYGPNGGFKTKLFASLIFNNPENLKAANAIIHPAVRRDFERWTQQRRDFPILAIEAAILIESGFSNSVDLVVNVASPLDLRIKRIKKRDINFTKEEIEARIKNQMPDEERSRLSDCIIYNDERHSLIEQTENLINKLVF
ncbi:MAG: dephospho-CoA kinase [Dysgonamonadaceae bacterium]|jgi:dephospho-CoA kinase|nr:dephospho-CoA kinase [Dysgonamonadaceae bacterium]